MKCPKCQAEMEPGFLYCKNCGEEIHMVPDFEPEIELSIHEIMTNVADDMASEVRLGEEASDENLRKAEAEDKRQRWNKFSFRILLGIGIAFVLLVLVFAVIGGIIRFRYYSYDYQMEQADACMSNADYAEAVDFYKRAVELDSDSNIAKYLLGEAYYMQGEYELVIPLYREVAASNENEEIRAGAINMIVSIYSEREDYAAISDFLLDLGDDTIVDRFQKYMAKAPEFSYVEGSYEEVIPLKLTSNTAGVIYYTVDGSIPDENSEVYSSPIFLEMGDYTITAYFVNEYGVSSDVVKKSYHVDVSIPIAPEISAYSGDYSSPTLIYVEVPDDCRVYYTSDGTEPGLESQEYSYPIHMPLGKSRFKFVSCNEEGIFSETVTREYNLELTTQVRVADAEAIITQGMLEYGKIYDLSGLSYEIYGRYLYKYQYVTNVENQGDFYILAEIYEDTQGIQNRTGALYAVGIYDGKRYRLSLDDNSQYVFEEF